MARHTLRSDQQLLMEALAALAKDKDHVVKDHLERVIENMGNFKRYHYPEEDQD